MKITNHKLLSESVSEIIVSDSTNNVGGVIDPQFIIIHFTAGQSAESSVEWFKNPSAKASAHLVIGRDGKIIQLVDFNKMAWHAGKSKWADFNGFNNFSIGIELDNPGRLTKVGDRYLSWFKAEYSKDNVVEMPHKHEKGNSYWYEYTKEQIDACMKVCKLIMEKYHIQDILGHDDIAPYRKDDPGPLFPMESFRSKLLGREDNTADIYEVIADAVNIRKGPSTKFGSYGQLNQATKVEFIKSSMGWFLVYVLDKPQQNDDTLYGWINGSLLKKL
ncbi:N-acetylmuramoyl-L-alanine amidase [Flexibacter flexilis DSM 6793]|uniref:N-acetylmuramoyl-L-alanine amidase n=1 Tax=Flexibacter flexilis DSM 6793 TaxID=927664 RepID=A0A1I1IBF7_9BACT|nr:N-acetylmuramoyl-L-alanine amidase [Flexibacter flexilis]SFC30620.1 N-acetylmuramoyl-L-alanine amidase [Flexibacter flexilis DSM 6793]